MKDILVVTVDAPARAEISDKQGRELEWRLEKSVDALFYNNEQVLEFMVKWVHFAEAMDVLKKEIGPRVRVSFWL